MLQLVTFKMEKINQKDVKCFANTYNKTTAEDGDSCQHAVGDGVWFDGIHDALVITVNPPLIWFGH